LISSVFALSSAAIAEMKISGSIEQTWKSASYDTSNSAANNTQKGSNALGQETNVKFSGSKDLANGLKTSGHLNLEDSAIDSTAINIGNDSFTVTFGVDTNNTINTTIIPRVGDDEHTVAGATVSTTDGLSSYSAHDKQHVGLTANVGKGAIVLNYAPSSAGVAEGDSSVADSGGSATEISYSGEVMPGLKVLVGQQVTEAANGSNDATERTYQFAYTNGAFGVGYAHRSFDDKASAAEVGKVAVASVSFAASDALSFSVSRAQTDTDGDADQEEITVFGVGYDLGGLAVTAQYAETKNIGAVAGDDGESFQVRTVYAF
jgi:predicted porin